MSGSIDLFRNLPHFELAMSGQNLMFIFSRIAHQLGRGVKREFPSLNKCELTLPGGFPFEAFNAKGEIKPWHVLNMVEASRCLSFVPLGNDERCFLDFNDVYSKAMAFIVTAKLKLTQDMYNLEIPKLPIKITKELLYHGSSTMNIRTSIYETTGSRLLAECQQLTVSMDVNTHRPTPLPQWWKTKYSEFSQPEANLRLLPLAGPSQSGASPLLVVLQPSETDFYQHANWTTFLKVCLDGIAGVEWQRNRKDLFPPLKTAEIAYKREMTLGEKYSISIWEGATSHTKHIEVVNDQKESVLQSTIEFH